MLTWLLPPLRVVVVVSVLVTMVFDVTLRPPVVDDDTVTFLLSLLRFELGYKNKHTSMYQQARRDPS